jgi:hypothetical protein
MIEWLKKRSLPTRMMIYAVVAILAFAVAAGVGATTALMVQGDLSLPTIRGEPGADGDQGDTPQRRGADADRSQQQKAAAQQQEGDAVEQKNTPRPQEAGVQQKDSASQQAEAQYVNRVGDIQANSVETFLDSHDKLLRYDALTSEDVEDLRANQAALQGFTAQVDDLSPPQKYREQYEVFSSAINELHEAATLAYRLAADPTAATQSGFDEYDRHVNEAAAGLQRSNEILRPDYKTIGGVQRVNPLS